MSWSEDALWRETAAIVAAEPPAEKFRRDPEFRPDDFFPPAAIAELLAEILATDTAEPIYVVRSGDLPPALTPRRPTLAFTGPNLHPAVDVHLDGRWPYRGVYAGPGPTLVLVDDTCDAQAMAMYENGEQETLGMAHLAVTTGAAIHEAAHWLDQGFHVTTEAPSANASSSFVESWCQLSAEGRDAIFDGCLPWFSHGPRFLRAAVHLWFRSHVTTGINIPGEQIVMHELYALSPLGEYRAALGAECSRSRNESIREVLATRPPEAFIDLWNNDVAEWGAEQSDEMRELAAADFLE